MNWSSPRGRLLSGRAWAKALLVAALALHLFVVASILAGPRPVIRSLHNDIVYRIGRGADFFAVYHAGRNLNRGVSPYANDDDGLTPYYYPFRYLPIVAYGGRVLALLPPQTAYALWILVLEALLALLLCAFWKRIEDARLRYFAACLLLLSSPYFLELYMGQFTFAALALLTLAVLFGPERRGSRYVAASAYTASVLLKVFPLVAAPAFLRHRRLWPHLALALLALLLFTLPYFILHPADWQIFRGTNFSYTSGLAPAGNYGTVYLLYLLMRDLRSATLVQDWLLFYPAYQLIVLGLSFGLVFFSKDDRIALGVMTMLLAHFLTYVHVWEHHTSGMVAAGLLLLTVEYEEKWMGSLIIFALTLLALPSPFYLLNPMNNPLAWEPDWPHYADYLNILPKVVPILLLYALSVYKLCKAGFAWPLKRDLPIDSFNR